MTNKESGGGYPAAPSVTTPVSTQNVYRLDHSVVLPVI